MTSPLNELVTESQSCLRIMYEKKFIQPILGWEQYMTQKISTHNLAIASRELPAEVLHYISEIPIARAHDLSWIVWIGTKALVYTP